MAPRGELSPPLMTHCMNPHPRNCYAHLTQLDNCTKSVGPPDMDMETIVGLMGTHPLWEAHTLCNYIQSVKSLVETVDTKCHNLRSLTVDTKYHNLGSTQGSDGSTKPAIKEGSVATVDTLKNIYFKNLIYIEHLPRIEKTENAGMIGKCHNLGFTRGSDGLVHPTLQDRLGRTMYTAPGELTLVTR